MNCQHCGTELSNKRAKNCPVCSNMLQQANRAGVYGFVMEAIAQAKEDGLAGEEMHEAMRAAAKYGDAKRSEWAEEYRQRLEARRQRNNERVAFEQDARQDNEVLSRLGNRGRGLTDQERADLLSEHP